MKALLVGLLFSSLAQAAPREVIIIRHAEKPADSLAKTLSPRGYQRAGLLVGFFRNNTAVNVFGPPVAIYAGAPVKAGGSVRSIETVTPLANFLHQPVITRFTKNDITPLVQEIMTNAAFEGRMVLICWEHSVIPNIVHGFGWTTGPVQWPDTVFDQAFRLDFKGQTVQSLTRVPELLLPGDTN